MPTIITPSWTDNVSVVSDQVLARGSSVRGTLDLRTKVGAFLFIALGRGGTAALSGGTFPGLDVLVRRVLNNGSAGGNPISLVPIRSVITAAASTTVSTTSNSGQAVLTVASGTGFAADDIICIQDSGGGVTRLEWARISKISGGTITLDDNLLFTHTSGQADTVRNKAEVYNPWIYGGSLYEVVFDYGDDTGGDSMTVRCMAQTYDSQSLSG